MVNSFDELAATVGVRLRELDKNASYLFNVRPAFAIPVDGRFLGRCFRGWVAAFAPVARHRCDLLDRLCWHFDRLLVEHDFFTCWVRVLNAGGRKALPFG